MCHSRREGYREQERDRREGQPGWVCGGGALSRGKSTREGMTWNGKVWKGKGEVKWGAGCLAQTKGPRYAPLRGSGIGDSHRCAAHLTFPLISPHRAAAGRRWGKGDERRVEKRQTGLEFLPPPRRKKTSKNSWTLFTNIREAMIEAFCICNMIFCSQNLDGIVTFI